MWRGVSCPLWPGNGGSGRASTWPRPNFTLTRFEAFAVTLSACLAGGRRNAGRTCGLNITPVFYLVWKAAVGFEDVGEHLHLEFWFRNSRALL